MTDKQINQVVESNRHICEICGEPVCPSELAYCDNVAHQYCVDEREEQMYRAAEFENEVIL